MNKVYSRINWKNYPSEETALNEANLNRMDLGLDNLDNRVIEMDATKVNKEVANSLVQSWSMDESTGIITITHLDGSKDMFDLNIEKIPVDFKLSEDGMEDYIYKSPARRVARIKKDTKKERELYESEIEMLAQCCRSIRDRALLEFMYATAARVSEVAGVDISDVDFEKQSVLLHGKGGKDRISYFTDKAALFLRKYLATRTDSNPALFVSRKNPDNRVTKNSIEQMIRVLGKQAGVDGSHPHRFRVTRITVLVNRGMPLQDVQELAGHSDINTTRMYYRSNKERVRYEYLKVA